MLAWTNNDSWDTQKKPDCWSVEPSVGGVRNGVTGEDPQQDLNPGMAAMLGLFTMLFESGEGAPLTMQFRKQESRM